MARRKPARRPQPVVFGARKRGRGRRLPARYEPSLTARRLGHRLGRRHARKLEAELFEAATTVLSELPTGSKGRARAVAAEARKSDGVRQAALKRHRSLRLPWLLAGLVVGLGEALYYAGQHAGDSHGAAGVAVAAAAILAPAAYFLLRPRSIPVRLRTWAQACLAALAGLFCWIVHRGMDPTTGSAVVGLTGALGIGWWRPRRPPDPTGPKPVVVEQSSAADWAAYVEPNYAKGTSLVSPEHDTDDKTGRVKVEHWKMPRPRGQLTYGQIMGQLPAITEAMHLWNGDLIIEPPPRQYLPDGSPDPNAQPPTVLNVAIVRDSPVLKPVLFTGPQFDSEGRVVLGPYADGRGMATRRWRSTNSVWGGYLLGGVGAGKSAIENLLSINYMSTEVLLVWYLDGDGVGASNAELAAHADWFVTAENAHIMLAALERIADMRRKLLRIQHWSGWNPCAEWPGIAVVVDESHNVFGNDPEGWGKAAREWRKVGIFIVAASQGAGVDDFGGKDIIRSNIATGNTVGMRTKSRVQEQLLPGTSMSLSTLPELPGYGYVVDAPDGRTAPFRALWVPSAADHEEGIGRTVPNSAQWYEYYVPFMPGLDDPSARAADNGEGIYRQRREAAEAELADLHEQVFGASPYQAQMPPPAGPTAGSTGVATVPRQSVLTSVTAAPVLPAPLVAAAEAIKLRPELAKLSQDVIARILPHLSEPAGAVWAAVASGAKKPARIRELLGLSDTRINDLLRELIDDGSVVKPGYAIYELAENADPLSSRLAP